MNVSIIVPAYNSAETIGETLSSLQSQRWSQWQAIVVDDGSTDKTVTIARQFAEQDPRIQVVRQAHMGVSAARNLGIRSARFDWLLFLDSDDWIAPLYLEIMTGELARDSSLDIVHCGWVRVTPEGTYLPSSFGPEKADLFPEYACHNIFALHACLVRKSLVESVGGFDPQQTIAEDWDLFQRIARTGARFGLVREVLAFYRMRENSASTDGLTFGSEGVRLLRQGHSVDPRVNNPDPAYANGAPAEHLSSLIPYWVCWAAGLSVGQGADPQSLLTLVAGIIEPSLEPWRIANNIFDAIILPNCKPHSAAWQLWPSVEEKLIRFLDALEASSGTNRLTRRVLNILECLILEKADAPFPLTIGSTLAVRMEITEPIVDIAAPQDTVRLCAVVTMEGAPLGILELPICDGLITASVLLDAMAAEYAWPILGRFFEYSVYPHLQIRHSAKGRSLWRNGICLALNLPEPDTSFWKIAHDQVGWTLFLQEFWSRPNRPDAYFYDMQARSENKPIVRHVGEDNFVQIEVSEPLPNIKVSGSTLNIAVYIGGVVIGLVPLTIDNHSLTAQQLRVALTMAGGVELCRVAVREGLLGRPLADPASLQMRLASAAQIQRERNTSTYDSWAKLSLVVHGNQIAAITDSDFLPGSENFLQQALLPTKDGLVLTRWPHQPLGTSASRRSKLPSASTQAILSTIAINETLAIEISRLEETPQQVIYAPEIIWKHTDILPNSVVPASKAQADAAAEYGRRHFETLFALRPDPWKYTNPYEQTKYEQTLALLPSQRLKRAIEIGCAEGHFTAQLAPHVDSLLAVDISDIALEHAGHRCADLPNVRFSHFDLVNDDLLGGFDLIVCSEMLYYMGGRDGLRVAAQKLAAALEPGGYLLTAHAHLAVDEPKKTGYNWNLPFGAKIISKTLSDVGTLLLIKELRVPLYRIQLFQRKERRWLPLFRRAEQVIEMEQPTPVPPAITHTIVWKGSKSQSYEAPQPISTSQLPILMYHRIAPTGTQQSARYRVAPSEFETQLRFLKDSGYYSIKLEDWQRAAQSKEPLPGQALLITFDDGYQDFLTHAWPLLKRYGFSATVFLVADLVGSWNSWNYLHGERVGLLNWEEIRELQSAGVEFGSHSMSHPPLTGLSFEQVVNEGIQSRAILRRELGNSITSFAYPYGDNDRAIQHLIGACGYTFGLSCRSGLAKFTDNLLALPRIEVEGSDTFTKFIAKLGVQ